MKLSKYQRSLIDVSVTTVFIIAVYIGLIFANPNIAAFISLAVGTVFTPLIIVFVIPMWMHGKFRIKVSE